MGRPRWPPSPLQSHADPIPSVRRSGPITPSHPSLHTRMPKWRASPGEMLGEQGATGASSLQLLLTPLGRSSGPAGFLPWRPGASVGRGAGSQRPPSPTLSLPHSLLTQPLSTPHLPGRVQAERMAPPPAPGAFRPPQAAGSGAVGPGTSARSSGLPLVRGQCLAGRFTWWL